MKVLLLALLAGVCYSAPSAPEMSAGFGTVEQGPEKVTDTALASDACQEHATRAKCSTPTPPTCQNPRVMSMVMLCDNRCICDPGYVLDGDEKCVKLGDCEGYDPDEQLGFNDGQDLASNAQSLDMMEPGLEEQSEEGDLMPQEPDTKEACTANQVFTDCGSACPKTCASPDGSMMCEQMCVIGCQCQEGFYMASDKTCVSLDDCY